MGRPKGREDLLPFYHHMDSFDSFPYYLLLCFLSFALVTHGLRGFATFPYQSHSYVPLASSRTIRLAAHLSDPLLGSRVPHPHHHVQSDILIRIDTSKTACQLPGFIRSWLGLLPFGFAVRTSSQGYRDPDRPPLTVAPETPTCHV